MNKKVRTGVRTFRRLLTGFNLFGHNVEEFLNCR